MGDRVAGMNEFFEYPVHFRCPSCGLREIARIQWGRPRFTKELETALDAGVVVLGGYMVASDSPRWRCRSCGHEFGDLGIRIIEYSRVGSKAPDHVAAYHGTMNNRDDLSRSDVCGCFCCESIYSPHEILEWVPDGLGATAVCPRCGLDLVLGSATGYPVTAELLRKMHAYWIDGEQPGGGGGKIRCASILGGAPWGYLVPGCT